MSPLDDHARHILVTLLQAMDDRRPVTIDYFRRDNEWTLRVIEPYEVRTTKRGGIVISAMDRLRREPRSFLPEEIRGVVVHRRAHYRIPVPTRLRASLRPPARTVRELIVQELDRDYTNDQVPVEPDTPPEAEPDAGARLGGMIAPAA